MVIQSSPFYRRGISFPDLTLLVVCAQAFIERIHQLEQEGPFPVGFWNGLPSVARLSRGGAYTQGSSASHRGHSQLLAAAADCED